MDKTIDRRRFLAAAAATAAGVSALGRSALAEEAPFSTKLHKSLIGLPNEKTLARLKAAGFEGIETNGPEAWGKSTAEAAKDRAAAEKLGMTIHSVLFGWANFNSLDAGQVARDVENVQTALRAAQGFGANTVLLVPCKIGGMPMPEPWEFDIRFDDETGHVSQIVSGDNRQYDKYIAAQNAATDATRKAVERLIPVAEKTGVVIALENVWNNLWVKPALFAHLVASFRSPWVQAYFDIGNHVKYAPPEEWIRALGRLIAKCHVKDFRLNPDGHGGEFVAIRDGSVNWPSVRRELDKIGYNGWLTIEGSGGLPLVEQNRRLDLILAGQ
ncbi:MAG: sugar phosphate isomerase/epimerase [Pirellulales bacterium]|nr:sugar phosphate isomerase/epimerase [Pirellulales bacterium]